MPLLLEPYEFFKRGSHRVVEVDPARLDEVEQALKMARVYGEPDPMVELINRHAEGDYEFDDFFASEDGYPAAYYLQHHILRIASMGEPFGLEYLGAIFAGELMIGRPLVDQEEAVSPEWLEVDPWMPYHRARATELLAQLDFGAGIDEDAISDVNEALDMGGLGVDVSEVSEFAESSTQDKWTAELKRRLFEFRNRLESIAAHDGQVLSWYDDNPTL